jgi:hypothetical protein
VTPEENLEATAPLQEDEFYSVYEPSDFDDEEA